MIRVDDLGELGRCVIAHADRVELMTPAAEHRRRGMRIGCLGSLLLYVVVLVVGLVLFATQPLDTADAAGNFLVPLWLLGTMALIARGVQVALRGRRQGPVVLAFSQGWVWADGRWSFPLADVKTVRASLQPPRTWRVELERHGGSGLVLFETSASVSHAELSRLLERCAQLLRVPWTAPAGRADNPNTVAFDVSRNERRVAAWASFDIFGAALLAFSSQRGSFVRFCALQRLTAFALWSTPAIIALVLLVWADAELVQPGTRLPGMPYLASLPIVVLLWQQGLALYAAAAALRGEAYLILGCRRIAKRWLPR